MEDGLQALTGKGVQLRYQLSIESHFRGRTAAAVLLALVCLALPGLVSAQVNPDAGIASIEESLVRAAAAVQEAVVTLEIHGSSKAMEGLPKGMERFFPIDGLGSGFIIDSDGTVLTNHHVVHEAEEIDLVLFDGRQFKAKFVASDRSSDVGIIRIIDPPKDLPVAALGDSDRLRVGEFAIAVGAPLGFQRSVTFGHISALHRSAIGERAPGLVAPGFEDLTLQDFIQVDTAINPGNSGGPLVNLRGQVIGVNAAIMAAPGGGLGFSIPINLAMNVARQLLAGGEVARAWLGVRMSDNNPAQAEAFDLPTSQGALVIEVVKGSPAALAKIQVDDLIVQVGDRVVRSSRDLVSAVSTSQLDSSVTLSLFRKERGKHRRREVQVALTKFPSEMTALRGPSEGTEVPKREGETAAEEDRSVISRRGKDADRIYLIRGLGIEMVAAAGTRRVGLEVSAVAARSFAEEAGLRRGDTVLEIGGRQVTTLPQMRRQLQGAERPFTSLVVQRDGRRRYLSIEVPR